jgi:hypothetical protein
MLTFKPKHYQHKSMNNFEIYTLTVLSNCILHKITFWWATKQLSKSHLHKIVSKENQIDAKWPAGCF